MFMSLNSRWGISLKNAHRLIWFETQNLSPGTQTNPTLTLCYIMFNPNLNTWTLGQHQLGIFHAPHIIAPSLPTGSLKTEVERAHTDLPGGTASYRSGANSTPPDLSQLPLNIFGDHRSAISRWWYLKQQWCNGHNIWAQESAFAGISLPVFIPPV